MHQARGLLMTHSPFYPLGVPDILLGEMPPLAMLPNLPLIAPQPATTAALNPLPPPQPRMAPLQLPAMQPPAPALQPLLQPLLAQPPAALPQPAAVAATFNQPQAMAPAPVPMHQASVAPLVAPATATSACLVPAGLYLGHGVMPLPQKLLAKILKLEFVEIHELLPETWLSSIDEEPSKCCSGSTKEKKRKPVTNIFTWLQGFASLVSALSTKYPTMVPEFLAYQSTIVKCYKDFEGLGWAQYDRAFRRQVAVTKDLRWSQINGTLYSLCFAGKAKKSAVCAHCLSDNHSTERCPEAPPSSSKSRQGDRDYTRRDRETAPICRLFNAPGGSRCRFKHCRYLHQCIACGQDHPKSACNSDGKAARPRS